MNIFREIRAYLGNLERRRRFYRTERLVRGLPADVLKDIGWPGTADGLDGSRQSRIH